MIRRSFLVLMLCSLAGCGFQLRGMDTPEAGVYGPVLVQQTHTDNPVRRRIKQQLAIHNVQIAKAADEAEYRFIVDEVERTDTVLTLDSDVRTAERLLTIEAELALQDKKGNILQSHRVREQRVLFTDPENPVGASTESQLVVSELEEATAQQVAQQLTRWLDKRRHETQSRPTF